MLRDADLVLRTEGPFAVGVGTVPWGRIARLVTAAGLVYGAVMGSLGGTGLGSLYSALKVPVLLTFTLGICVPSFYVMHAVLGLREDFAAAVRGILSAQGTVAVVLCAAAPLTAFVYACGANYPTALLWNGLAFLLATAGGQVTLARHYRPLVARNRRHRWSLGAWFVLYAFVALKVGWVLRPFVGDPGLSTTFLREGRWHENPYTTLFWTVTAFLWSVLERLHVVAT